MFRKSRLVIRRALQRFYNALRRKVTGINIYSVGCLLSAAVRPLDFRFLQTTHTLNMVAQQIVIRSEEVVCRVRDADTSFNTEVNVDQSPTHCEAEVSGIGFEQLSPPVIDSKASLPSTEISAVETDFVGKLEPRSLKVVQSKSRVFSISGNIEAKLRSGDRLISNLPMCRTGLDIYRLTAEDRVAYWQELVSQIGKQPFELELIGVFSRIPMRGIRRIGFVARTGTLQLWLEHASRGAPVTTLILAKDRSSGKLYRVFCR